MGELPAHCHECKGHCNSKGYPSVMRGSKYCEQQRGVMTQARQGIWMKIQSNKLLSHLRRAYNKSRGR